MLIAKDDPNNAFRINDDLCISCGICVDECPVNAISEEDDRYIIDESTCLICSQCLEACPTQAMDPIVDGKLYLRQEA